MPPMHRLVMAKPRKVEEPAGTYKPVQRNSAGAPEKSTGSTQEIRYADSAAGRRAAKKVFETHRELFRRLAQ